MSQTLETIIAINATIGNGFSQVGTTLTQLGNMIDGLSDKLIGFGKESLNTYKDYELSMSETRAALAAAYGKDTKELNDAMVQLDEKALEWAHSTRFHTDDIANAMNTAAHASWTAEDITENMGLAMQLANAGAMDLSDAVTLLVTAQHSLGVENDDLGHFIDIWAYAASRSVGDIQSFGDTLDALGSVGRFADTNEELFTMIGMMHDMGTSGSAAATLLRTTWMRMLAPSGLGGKVLDNLGATEEEIASIRQDAELIKTMDFLGSMGFSAYDANGQAKPLLQTFSELRDVLAVVAGGYDKISSNEQALGILNTLFGIRGMKGALNIFEGLDKGLELFGELNSGMAEGYGAYYSDTMMDTLWGQTELYESKIENLKTRTGEVLSSQVQPVMEAIGGIVDSVASLDTGSFNALVIGAEALAVAGPGLLLAGSAFRFIGSALAVFSNPVSSGIAGIAAAAIAATALMGVLGELDKADYQEKFGTMTLDNSAINAYVQGIAKDYDAAYKSVHQFKTEFEASIKTFQDQSSSFSSALLTDMLTGVDVKEGSPEYEKLFNMGDSIISAVSAGIEAHHNEQVLWTTQLFGDPDDPEAITDPLWASIMESIEANYEKTIARARELGQSLRDALTEALRDSTLTGEELDGIRSIMDEYNQLMAEQIDRRNYQEQQRAMYRAQTMGLSGLMDTLKIAAAERDRELEEMWVTYAGLYFDYEKSQRELVGEGPGKITQEQMEANLAGYRSMQQEAMISQTARLQNLITQTLDKTLSTSDFADEWQAVQDFTEAYRAAGGVVTKASLDALGKTVDPSELAGLAKYVNNAIDMMGGLEKAQQYADYLGDTEEGRLMRAFADAYTLFGDGVFPTAGAYDGGLGTGSIEQLNALLAGGKTDLTAQDLANIMHAEGSVLDNTYWGERLGETLFNQVNQAAMAAGFAGNQSISDWLAFLMPGAVGATLDEDQRRELTGINALSRDVDALSDEMGRYTGDMESDRLMRERYGAELQSAQSELENRALAFEDTLTPMQGEMLNYTQSLRDAEAQVAAQSRIDALTGDIGKLRGDIDSINEGGLWTRGARGNMYFRQSDEQAEAAVQQIQADIVVRQNELADLYAGSGLEIPVTPYIEGTDAVESLRDQGVQVEVEGDTQQLQATIDGADGQTLMTYVNGDATNLSMSIQDQDGKTLTENVTGNASSLASIISSYDGRTITVNIRGNNMIGSIGGARKFAAGGRSDVPAIFGEAGPEWAIPEEHSERTAELLDAARAASGFTWPDLIARYGGLNANPNNVQTTLVYSPTIHAQDAEGVEEKLIADKARLEKWWAEKQMRDEMEVYA